MLLFRHLEQPAIPLICNTCTEQSHRQTQPTSTTYNHSKNAEKALQKTPKNCSLTREKQWSTTSHLMQYTCFGESSQAIT